MLTEEQRELLKTLTEIRERLQKLSLHVVQMFRLVDEVLEKIVVRLVKTQDGNLQTRFEPVHRPCR